MKILNISFLFLFYLGCSSLGNKAITNENRVQYKAVYEDKNVKVIAYMDYKILHYKIFKDDWNKLIITVHFDFKKAKQTRYYMIDGNNDITTVGRALVGLRDNDTKIVAFLGATPEWMKNDEDFAFVDNHNSYLSRSESIFRLFYTSFPVTVNVESDWHSANYTPLKYLNYLKKIKKLIFKIEYFDNPNLFAKNGFKTIKELNFYASMYNYYYPPPPPPLGKDGEPNWSLLKNMSDELKNQKKMFYKKSRQLYKLIKDNRKILKFEFDVDFSKKFIKNKVLDFGTKNESQFR